MWLLPDLVIFQCRILSEVEHSDWTSPVNFMNAGALLKRPKFMTSAISRIAAGFEKSRSDIYLLTGSLYSSRSASLQISSSSRDVIRTNCTVMLLPRKESRRTGVSPRFGNPTIATFLCNGNLAHN